MNKHRGDSPITLGGGIFTLNFDWTALAELEDALGEDYLQKIIEGMTRMSAKITMTALAAGLKKHHPEHASVEALGKFDDPPATLAEPLFQALGLGLWGNEDFFAEAARRAAEAEQDIEAERKRVEALGGGDDPTEAEAAATQ